MDFFRIIFVFSMWKVVYLCEYAKLLTCFEIHRIENPLLLTRNFTLYLIRHPGQIFEICNTNSVHFGVKVCSMIIKRTQTDLCFSSIHILKRNIYLDIILAIKSYLCICIVFLFLVILIRKYRFCTSIRSYWGIQSFQA